MIEDKTDKAIFRKEKKDSPVYFHKHYFGVNGHHKTDLKAL